jgi:HK97 family phage major capsid protein
MPEVSETKLAELLEAQKGFREKAAEEMKNHGTMLQETKTKIDNLQTQLDAIDLKLVQKHIGEQGHGSTLVKTFEENEGVQRMLRDKKGHAVINVTGRDYFELMGRKTIISNVTSGSQGGDTLNPVGAATTGVLPIDRTPGIVAEARQTLRLRDVLSARPTTAAFCDFVKVTTPMAIASPVAEAALKPENSVSFASVSEKVRLLATWIPATRQVLDDFTELMGFLQSSLGYYVGLAEEKQMLAGDGTGENLHGLIPQATAFNAGLLPAAAKGWNKIDVLGAAVQQIAVATELDPTFAILNPTDWWNIRLTKDGFGRYILGEPGNSAVSPSIFGITIVPTTSMAAGTFLVGSGSPAAVEIRDRMSTQIEISTEHSDYFVRNLVAVRAEKRLALLTKRPASLVSGTFTTSP